MAIYEQAGPARFTDAHTVESDNAPLLQAGKVIICSGGVPRPMAVPGFELTATHSDAWHLSSVPPSLLVIGAGATGVQVASIFNAFGARVHLVEIAPRILMTEDREVSEAVRAALAESGIEVIENAGTIDRFERCAAGVRLIRSSGDGWRGVDAAVAVVAAGSVEATAGLDLARRGVQNGQARVRPGGHVPADDRAAHLRRRAMSSGARWWCTRRSAKERWPRPTPSSGRPRSYRPSSSPIGSFTDPEYALVGLTEAAARQTRDVAVATIRFDSLPRPIIDGRPTGFCKLVVDRESHAILGCHVVGERAVELAQLAATAMAAQMPVEQLALVPFSFPTYANALGRAAVVAAVELDHTGMWAVDHLVTPEEIGVT